MPACVFLRRPNLYPLIFSAYSKYLMGSPFFEVKSLLIAKGMLSCHHIVAVNPKGYIDVLINAL